MILRNTKILFVFFLLFFLDLFKPLGYYLNVDFLFLGIVFLSLGKRVWLAIILGIFFGYLRDSFILQNNTQFFSFLEFPIFSLIARYLITYSFIAGKTKYATILKNTVALLLIALHAIVNSIFIGYLSFFFFLSFIFQSFILFIVADKLLARKLQKLD